MRCFVLPEIDFQPGQIVELPAELVRHVCDVLRLKPGTEIKLLDGTGRVALARLQPGQRATILEVSRTQPAPIELCLIQGMPKGEKLELVLQKGTELGVSRFCLVEMDRSLSRLKPEKREGRLERWQRIVQEAARQCGQSHLPGVEYHSSLREVVRECPAELKLLLWEAAQLPLPEQLPERPPRSVAVIVGPEGGVAPEEAEMVVQGGFLPVRLGGRILRTETAGLAIASILQYLYGDLSICPPCGDAAFQGKDEP